MVHVVKKIIQNKTYLYLQRSICENGKRRTEHVAYLGRQGKLSDDAVKAIIEKYNHQELAKSTLKNLVRKYSKKEVGKNENKRVRR